MAHQVLEEPELARLQVERLSIAGYRTLQEIHFEVLDPQNRLRRGYRWPARERVDPREQLRECEGLEQIIVTACVESGDAVVNTAEGSQEQHRRSLRETDNKLTSRDDSVRGNAWLPMLRGYLVWTIAAHLR